MTRDSLPPESAALLAALVDAYRRHASERIAALVAGDPPAGTQPLLEEGEEWLRSELESVLSLPYPDQGRTPLEVFQEAMRFPTAALQAAGVAPLERDPTAEAALPGDRYDLAPASSQELGEGVWRAHLAWGAAKAAAMTRPAVGLLSRDLIDRSRIEEAVTSAGFELLAWANVGAVGGGHPVRAFVDLEHPDADAAIGVLAEAGVRVVAYGPHVDDFAMGRAASLGAAEALPRSRFFTKLPELLPTLT